MKKVISTLFALLLMGSVVIFSIAYIFNGAIAGGTGIFQGIGNILDTTATDKTTTLPTMNSSASTKTPPIIKYESSSHEVDSSIVFKSLFTVITENGEKNGVVEDDFVIYLSDIRSTADASVVEFLTTEQIEALKEIPVAFIYDIQTDTLYCHQSGVYKVLVKIYGNNGTQAEYEFSLPIEAD